MGKCRQEEMKKVNDQGSTMYIVTLKDKTKTRFWFMNESIIEELFTSYDIPFIKVKCKEKYEWKPEEASNYWREKKW